MSKELLLEIGTEEIPAGFMPQALKAIEELIRRELTTLRIGFENVKTLGTPRRLVLYIKYVSEKQEDTYIEVKGPAKKVAFNEKEEPTQAAIGFARAQGVHIEDLQEVNTPKGLYMAVRKRETGSDTKDILSLIMPKLITSIPFPKSMRWMVLSVRFARPIHWILCLFGGEVVPFEVGNIQSGDFSYGHRFMEPSAFKVSDYDSYIRSLKKSFVITDPIERKERIRDVTNQAAKEVSGKVLEDEELLEKVNYLVEYPTAVVGSFDKKFLSLPREVLISSMREHQMYFSVVDQSGELLPHFITVNNTAVTEPEVVVKGNERVLRARLADAEFFFEEDQKTPLYNRVSLLKNVIFQSELGTLYEKVMRVQKITEYVTSERERQNIESGKRAALLCKADLTTGMVGEFPKLQGVMGREYALLSEEDPEVATAIYEHYLPRFAGDGLPCTHTGAFLSIADKLDTIVGCFGVGLIPTGTSDPHALRRQALGIINIILDREYSISLDGLIEQSIEYLSDKILKDKQILKDEVLKFFRLRLQHLLISQGYSYDVLDAVLSLHFHNIVDSFERIKALHELKSQPDFTPLAVAFKRASNILSQSPPGKKVDVSLFQDPAEDTLFEKYNQIRESTVRIVSEKNYKGALRELVQLREPVDNFFDNVMVMAEDEKTRTNRLTILSQVSDLFLMIADFTKIVTE
ncbi:MAG: glycine--tRNA ligase subunit beta [Thermodesulfobacteriota bacterium]|nr:glycine--tRNA ligase subunit beta [Thermodesulfobacteriota bacterium]